MSRCSFFRAVSFELFDMHFELSQTKGRSKLADNTEAFLLADAFYANRQSPDFWQVRRGGLVGDEA